ncbi:hypothetical protein ABZ942_19640 [Nocardia sp. NPDC046473]|uniref:hypothetical protein n=1 Tax=Nocardia sp. NPDC046473 TaxID=3155733 RepID=UPI0033FEBFA6
MSDGLLAPIDWIVGHAGVYRRLFALEAPVVGYLPRCETLGGHRGQAGIRRWVRIEWIIADRVAAVTVDLAGTCCGVGIAGPQVCPGESDRDSDCHNQRQTDQQRTYSAGAEPAVGIFRRKGFTSTARPVGTRHVVYGLSGRRYGKRMDAGAKSARRPILLDPGDRTTDSGVLPVEPIGHRLQQKVTSFVLEDGAGVDHLPQVEHGIVLRTQRRGALDLRDAAGERMAALVGLQGRNLRHRTGHAEQVFRWQ